MGRMVRPAGFTRYVLEVRGEVDYNHYATVPMVAQIAKTQENAMRTGYDDSSQRGGEKRAAAAPLQAPLEEDSDPSEQKGKAM